MQETLVQYLGWEDPLEEEMATPSSILVWRIPMDRGAWWAAVHGVAESDMTWRLDKNNNMDIFGFVVIFSSIFFILWKRIYLPILCFLLLIIFYNHDIKMFNSKYFFLWFS